MQGGIPVSRHPWWYNATESCTTLVRSQAWIWCFLVMKAMSVDLSIGLWWFMLRDKRHCLHVLWFEPGNATCNNPTPSKYSNPCARTQYQCNITYKNINSIENCIYIVQLCSAFQTVECKIQNKTVLQKSKEKVHAVVFVEWKPQACRLNVMRQHLNARRMT